MVATWTPLAHARDLAMPDLQELEREGRLHFELLAFGNMFTGMGVPGVPGSYAHAHYKNFVRLVDTAIRRYGSARVYLQRCVDRPGEETRVADYVRSLSELEAMFSVLHRALTLLVRLKGAPEAPVGAKDLLPFDEAAVKKIRHASEHIDSFLQEGEIGSDDDVMLRTWREGISFAGQEISYATIAMWLRRLHSVVRRLIDHDPLADERAARQAAAEGGGTPIAT